MYEDVFFQAVISIKGVENYCKTFRQAQFNSVSSLETNRKFRAVLMLGHVDETVMSNAACMPVSLMETKHKFAVHCTCINFKHEGCVHWPGVIHMHWYLVLM